MASDGSETNAQVSYYLMKAEPDSRIVKGKDVKFSVDDFEVAEITAWEGVRNHEAKNIMKGMNLGDKVLFYHSNTKDPGVAGFAEVSKEAYPDHTAWDKDHPYFDPKSDSESPKWFMVDLRFVSRLSHFVSLALLRYLSTISTPPSTMAYLQDVDLRAIKGMALLNKGRLSVQRVTKEAWDAIGNIAEKGYEGFDLKASTRGKDVRRTKKADDKADISQGNNTAGKRKAKFGQSEGTRKSKRTKM